MTAFSAGLIFVGKRTIDSDCILPFSIERNSAENEQKPKFQIKSNASPFKILIAILTVLLMILGIADLFDIVNFMQYEGAFVLIGFTAFIEYTVCCVCQLKSLRTVRFFGKFLLAVTLLELTVFQFPSYNILTGEQPQKTLNPADAVIESGECKADNSAGTVTMKGKEEVILTFNDINQPVNTFYFETKYGIDTDHIKVTIDAADSTHSDYRYDIISSDIIKGRKNSQYISCQLSGNVDKIRVKFSGYNTSDVMQISAIKLNEVIPFEVLPIRIGLLLFLGTFAYAIIFSSVLRKPYEKTRKLCGIVVAAMTAVLVFVAVNMVTLKFEDDELRNELKLTTGNQITQELVDAFENKQIHLTDTPDQQLLDLENPYDWSQRNSSGAIAKWDHVLHDGKYYSYYGIAPVVLFYLPYHLIKGYYCSTSLSIAFFSAMGIIFLSLTYMAFIRRFCKKTSAGCVLAGYTILLSSCGIWYNVGRTLFYEISISSGFMFVAIGAYFFISSNIFGGGKISAVKTALSSLFLGLAVLCRPTLAVYCIAAAIFFIFAIPRSGVSVDENGLAVISRKKRIIYALCAAIPMLALGIIQMYYNYARFGSPMDFGIKYSLTINDFTNSQYHTEFVLIGILNYLFAMPSITADYPFITTPFSKMGVSGYYFSDIGNTSGIIFLAFPVLAYLLGRRALKWLPDNKSRLKAAARILLPCVIMPIVIICSVWESGYAVRYTADFSWQMVIGALAILFFLYQKSENEMKKDLARKFMAVSMIAAVVINGIQIFNFTFTQTDFPDICDKLNQMIAFWK